MKPRFLLVVGRYRARREERAPLTTAAARTLRLPHHLEGDRLARLQRGLNAADVFAAVDLFAVQLHDDVAFREADVIRERAGLDGSDQYAATAFIAHVLTVERPEVLHRHAELHL